MHPTPIISKSDLMASSFEFCRVSQEYFLKKQKQRPKMIIKRVKSVRKWYTRGRLMSNLNLSRARGCIIRMKYSQTWQNPGDFISVWQIIFLQKMIELSVKTFSCGFTDSSYWVISLNSDWSLLAEQIIPQINRISRYTMGMKNTQLVTGRLKISLFSLFLCYSAQTSSLNVLFMTV